MARITLLLDQRNKKAERFPLVIRVSHKSKVKYLQTGYKLLKEEWSKKRLQIKPPFRNHSRANANVQMKISVASRYISDNVALIKELDATDLAELIAYQFKEKESESATVQVQDVVTKRTKLVDFTKKVVDRYRKANRFGMAKGIEEGIHQILKHHGNNNLLLTEIDEIFLEDLEAAYLGKGNSINGLGVRLRYLRRVFNLAIKDKSTEVGLEHYPFGRNGYSIKQCKTKKRAIRLEDIQAIRKLELKKGSTLWHHRNYFLFMFNCRGMNFIDLSYLKRDAIRNDRLIYKRRKTRRGASVKEFDIRLTAEARMILSYYLGFTKSNILIFPILAEVFSKEDPEVVYEVYKEKLRNHNRRLHTIGQTIGLDIKLTTYVARHTFATAGLFKGISKAQIGDMLGHTNYYTTESYFEDFDKEILDEAAERILN